MEMNEGIEIVRGLARKLEKKASELQLSVPRKETTAWTAALKSVLAALGNDYESLYSSKEKDLHEFMVDFSWWDTKRKVLVLACESEFGNARDWHSNPGRVGEDFDKLLSIKAELKLMVFDSYLFEQEDGSTATSFVRELNRHMQEFGQHCMDEIYLLLDTRDLEANNPKIWKCQILKSGPDTTLTFEFLGEK